jgi:hypothetical protein
VTRGRFKGYASPEYVDMLSVSCHEVYTRMLNENYEEWQDRTAEELPIEFMRRQNMLNEIRSTRTDGPSETLTTAAAAAAAAAADTAATKAAAATIARLEQELGEMAAAVATTTAAANAAATAAAEETARLQRELDEMTNWLRIAYTPQVIYPTPMDQREMDKWAEWCDSTPWGTHSPAPTPTPQSRHTDTRNRREHHLHGHPASSSAQPSVSVPTTRSSGKRDHTSGPTPIPTLTPTPGNRKGTQAHAPGVSTLLQPAPSLHSHAFSGQPVLPLRSPTNTSTNKRPPPQPPQPGWQDHRGTPGIPPEREHPPQANRLSAPPNPMCPT